MSRDSNRPGSAVSHSCSKGSNLKFNLTTHRYNERECEAMMQDVSCIALYGCLRDRFGDHGLVSVMVARPDRAENVLRITDWIMSCRVLARGVEEYLMNYAVQEAARLNLELVEGTYIPTAKNAMLKEFFPRFGFENAGETSDRSTRWRLRVADYQSRKTYIHPEEKQHVSLAGGSCWTTARP